ncbi:Gag protease polyprotein [Gossypium australe]|uniref:Gag protease polyprotein n=1 Tax=Gossypium australe TaxID=47621 RepID=A0A5B6WP15_9ROSI|nr:Gag protease polyprotein [Gossypium australe]
MWRREKSNILGLVMMASCAFEGGFELKQTIIWEMRASPYSMHLGGNKMYWDVKKLYWWLGLKRDVIKFVAKCLTCQQFPSRVLQQIKIPQWKWERIMIDFVSRLPLTPTKKDSIWVIVYRLTKSAHFLSIHKDYSLQKLDKLYISKIVRLHGVPISIISDRYPCFTSRFWKKLQESFGTNLDFSIAFHPQFNRQSDWVIQILEDMLRGCIIEFPGSWEELFP